MTTNALPKPQFGSPCNGCGLCCKLALCNVAETYFAGASAPCPALEWEAGRAWCGLIRHPSRHLLLPHNADSVFAPLFMQVIPIGQGCGMPDEEQE